MFSLLLLPVFTCFLKTFLPQSPPFDLLRYIYRQAIVSSRACSLNIEKDCAPEVVWDEEPVSICTNRLSLK